MSEPSDKPATRLVHAGRDPFANHGVVNPPVYHASTILFPTAEDMEAGRNVTPYGRRGTPPTFAFEDTIAELEGGAGCRLTPSGMAAVTLALLTAVEPGGHVLMVDTTYDPTRIFCDKFLKRMKVETEYYDPSIGDGIDLLFRGNTQAVFAESPGSRTFEVQDIPAIASKTKAAGIPLLMDNTWATPLLFPAIERGVDLSIQAATKYIVGHSDALLGTVTASEAWLPRLAETHRALGLCAGPDDVYLAQRGLRTMHVRLKHQEAAGLEIARWLQGRPEVLRVLHPALPDDPGHALWQRDFSGACGLFGVEFRTGTTIQRNAFLNALRLFGMGYSWGGFESLIVPTEIEKLRTATRWPRARDERGPIFRLSIGLEDSGDLIADLERGFDAFHAAAGDKSFPETE